MHKPEISISPKFHGKAFYAIMIVLVAFLAIEYLLNNISDIISDQLKTSAGIALFILISAVSIFGQLYLLSALKKVTAKGQLKRFSLRTIVEVTQYVLIGILVITILQVVFSSEYTTAILIISTTVSYILVIAIMAILARKQLIWFKRSKNLALLFYAIGSIVILFNSISNIMLTDGVLMQKEQTITPDSEVIFDVGSEPGTTKHIVVTVQAYSYSAIFLIIWAGTFMMLRHNIQRIGRIKFWALVLLPLVFFMTLYVGLYPYIFPDTAITEALPENLTMLILLYSAAPITIGILFGLSFLLIARSVNVPRVKVYIVITGTGFILFFTTVPATVLQAGYPPYGLVDVSTVALAAYMIFFGLYNSAVAIANDINLRQLVRKTLIDKSKLLDSIGDAQMKNQLEDNVLNILSKNAARLESESGTPPSMTKDEMTQYVQAVVREIKK